LHGTSTERKSAPSTPSLEGRLIAAGFAGGGYLLVAPDYIGLGISMALHPYLHVDSTVNSTVDLLRAAREFCRDEQIEWPKQLNLMGFSQGAHATLAVQRYLEAHPEPGLVVSAAAAVDGSYDLADIGFPLALAGGAPSHPVYLGYLINAYAAIYGRPINSLLKEPYTSRVPTLFDGSHGNDDVVAGLPRNPREMFTTEFLTGLDAGESNWFLDALAQNQVFQWSPSAPLRLYYGDLDLDVSPREAATAAADMRARGGNVESISVGAYNHEQAIFHAFARVRAWFDELNPSR
jgi:pimeloyl-ACP methyl ester carboxylesterase